MTWKPKAVSLQYGPIFAAAELLSIVSGNLAGHSCIFRYLSPIFSADVLLILLFSLKNCVSRRSVLGPHCTIQQDCAAICHVIDDIMHADYVRIMCCKRCLHPQLPKPLFDRGMVVGGATRFC